MKIIKYLIYGWLFWEHQNNKFEDNLNKWKSGEMSSDEFLHRINVWKYPR